MKADVVLAGVGGQGILSIAAVLAEAARRHGLAVIQAEVHGMAQRGGAVVAGLRIADGPIAGALIPRGSADLLLGTEPVEALRYADRLSPGGTLLSAAEPFENIPDYPPITGIHDRIRAIPGALLVEARALAEEAGSRRSANVVMVGAASRFLPIPQESILECIREAFAAKGERMAKVNERAFAAGREATTAPAAP